MAAGATDIWITLLPTVAGFAGAVIADRKNRNGTAWGLGSFIIPLCAIVVAFLKCVAEAVAGPRRRSAIGKWIGVPMGVLILLAGFSLMLHQDPASQRHWLTGIGLGVFLLWRSFRRDGETAENRL